MYLICDELILSQNVDTMQYDVMTPINNVFLNYFHVLRPQEQFKRETNIYTNSYLYNIFSEDMPHNMLHVIQMIAFASFCNISLQLNW